MSGRRGDVLNKSGTFLNQGKRTRDGNSTRTEKMSCYQNQAFSEQIVILPMSMTTFLGLDSFRDINDFKASSFFSLFPVTFTSNS